MPDMWMPGAINRSVGNTGAMNGGANKVTWHRTANASADSKDNAGQLEANYFASGGAGAAPHLVWDTFTGEFWQFFPANSRALALRNYEGYQTNRSGTYNIQIEIAFENGITRFGKYYATVADTPLKNLDKLIAWLRTFGIPDVWPGGITTADVRDTVSWTTYNGTAGHYGHSQVPGNDHVDPGKMPTNMFSLTTDTRPWISGRQVIWASTATVTDQNRVVAGPENPKDDVGWVQGALVKSMGLTGYTRGIWASSTQAKYDEYRRVKMGLTGTAAEGTPGLSSLTHLGDSTGVFRPRDFEGTYTPVYESTTPPPTDKTHTVVSDDTLWKLSQTYAVTVEQLKSWNALTSDTIEVGWVLIVALPVRGTHTVMSGDTLTKIARVYLVTVDQIKTWNGLTSDVINVGQVLKVKDPASGTTTTPPPAPDTAAQIDPKTVTFNRYTGSTDSAEWIRQGCAAAGVPFNDYWLNGYKTALSRESGGNANACNLYDSNAVTPAGYSKVADWGDGYYLNGSISPLNGTLTHFQCSRGPWQTIPQTFARYHAAGTSVNIYDPVSSCAASIRYVRANYGVSADGSDLASKVQQFDPNRPPKGY